MSEIPLTVFKHIISPGAERAELPTDHLGGRRTIAFVMRHMDDYDLWALFTEHPELNCSSCQLFPSRGLAEKGFLPTCCVQVGPHNAGWDEEQGACLQELKTSFSVPNPPPPYSSLERWVDVIRLLFIALEKIAEPVEFLDLAMDLVE